MFIKKKFSFKPSSLTDYLLDAKRDIVNHNNHFVETELFIWQHKFPDTSSPKFRLNRCVNK